LVTIDIHRIAVFESCTDDQQPHLTIARTDGCPIAGLTIGPRAWTIQPHPEFVPELADDLLARREDLIGAEKTRTARATLHRPLDRGIVASWIRAFFADAG